jgi:hypothetical protein
LHDADEPGVYGMLYRPEAYAHIYIILLRPTQNLALQRVIMFHELAHILFDHTLTEVAGVGSLRGFMVSDAALVQCDGNGEVSEIGRQTE